MAIVVSKRLALGTGFRSQIRAPEEHPYSPSFRLSCRSFIKSATIPVRLERFDRSLEREKGYRKRLFLLETRPI